MSADRFPHATFEVKGTGFTAVHGMTGTWTLYAAPGPGELSRENRVKGGLDDEEILFFAAAKARATKAEARAGWDARAEGFHTG